jgi:hypothetical protein
MKLPAFIRLLSLVMVWGSASFSGLLAEEAVVGPRGAVGPDVSPSESENRSLGRHIVVKGHSAVDVQSACERAVKEGVRTVFLPAGEYVFDKTVNVPGGLTILGEGSKTVIRAGGKNVRLFAVKGDDVRFTRLKLVGADTTTSTSNNSYGIIVSRRQNVRIDHCELLGFSRALSFSNEATGQVDHCIIHHNLRDGLGYGIVIYSGAYVLVMDNEFYQNRHSLASTGALDWSSPKRLGKYVHKPGFRKTHWEFVHNRVGSNDKSTYELCAVDTHPGMDGTFVVERNIFESLRYGVGIRDGSGIIRDNVFRNLRTRTTFRPLIAISISYGTHNGIPVEGCMPNYIEVYGNVFLMPEGVKYEKCRIGKAENIYLDGEFVMKTASERLPPATMPRLIPMSAGNRLGIKEVRRSFEKPARARVSGRVIDESDKPIEGARVHISSAVAVTDRAGRFSVSAVPVGERIVAVCKSGYECEFLDVRVTEKGAKVECRLRRDRRRQFNRPLLGGTMCDGNGS